MKKFFIIVGIVLITMGLSFGQTVYDDLTLKDDLVVTDDASVGGDLTVTGSTYGQKVFMSVHLDVAVDGFLFGDTSAVGMFVPRTPLKLIDVHSFASFASGDTLAITVYEANGDAVNDTMATATFAEGQLDSVTVSSTHLIVDNTEGLAVYIDDTGSTPNVTLTLEFETIVADTE